MIDGVTIIETITKHTIPLWFAITVTVIIAILFVWLICVSVKEIKAEGKEGQVKKVSKDLVLWTVLPALALLVLGSLFWCGYRDMETEYVVTIDESVSYVEFTENYEVISQDGDLYTVRLIEETNNSNNG